MIPTSQNCEQKFKIRCLFTDCNFTWWIVSYGENDWCLNMVTLFCDEEREEHKKCLDLCTIIVEQQSLKINLVSCEFGLKM